MRDQRVPKIVNQMFWDPQLREMVDPLMEAFTSLIGALPRHLGGLGSESSLNPLAAHIFKAMADRMDWPRLLAQDQLLQEKAAGNAFAEFIEGKLRLMSCIRRTWPQ